MGRLREQAKKCREIGKEHVDDPDAPAIADEDGDGERAEWVKIAMLLQYEEIGKPLRHCEDYLNEMPGILDVFGLEKSPDHTSFWNWDKEFPTRELRSLLRRSAEQAGISGIGAIDASGFQRDQTSYHYRKRAGYSFQKLKSTPLVDTESLAIIDAHFTTKKAYDGLIWLHVCSRNGERPTRVPRGQDVLVE